jgi:L-ascorbate metabolism protein UlaG (beta-lactamase superfamily)
MAGPRPYPVSDHCDGERFRNPAGPAVRSFLDLPKWWWQRLRGQGERWPATASAPRVPVLPAQVADGQVAVTPVGHATFLLQFPGCTVLTDPVFAHRAGPWGLFGPPRIRPPALRREELPAVDLVVLSHNHYDHLDLDTLRWLSRERRPQVITPLGNKPWLERNGVGRVTELDWWQSHLPHPEMHVVCTPAQHWSSRGPWDRCRTLWGGFMLKTPAGSVFFCGDSGWGSHFTDIRVRLGPAALALLPIGAYEPRWFMEAVHLNPEEAVRAHLALGARRSIGMHYGTWQLTDEGIDAPLHALAEAVQTHGIKPDHFTTLDFGETRVLPLA